MNKGVPGGYNGKILRVNLSNRSATVETIDELFCRRYIGGAGFILYYLWKELKPGVDPLSPDNKLIFANGPISGQNLPGTARHCVGAKSPLANSIAKSESGGFWAAEFKRAGYDAIIIEGKAEKPVYLWIQDGQVNFKNANNLWGKETKETEAAIRAEVGDNRAQVASIGPAGENMVRYACIMHGCYDVAGRGGLGAVMGSKNLKAVAVRGHTAPKIADKDPIKEIRQWLMENMYKDPIANECHDTGTGGPYMEYMEPIGNLPIRNFRDGLFPETKQITAVAIKDTIRIGMEGCFACPVRCKKVVQFEEPYHVDPAYGGPEYETLAGLGSNCGISNLKAIAKGNERCNAYSLDTISTGGVIAFAMECFEKGLLSKKDTDGIELRFGNDEAMLKAIELIARRQGFGNFLAEGTARMAEKIGKGAEKFAMHTKGLEAGYHEPRLHSNLALAYMIRAEGADHCAVAMPLPPEDLSALGILAPESTPYGPRDVGEFRIHQFKLMLQDAMLTCVMVPYTLQLQVKVMKAVTGWDTSIAELLRVGERIITVARLLSVREGFFAADDVLPERFFQPKTDGPLAKMPIDRAKIEKAKRFYYILMSWDENGVPLPEKIEELEIE
jgi:aldehyde:ferredoxin oxidoreductase